MHLYQRVPGSWVEITRAVDRTEIIMRNNPGRRLLESLPSSRWDAIHAGLDLTRVQCVLVGSILGDMSEVDMATLLKVSKNTVHTYLQRLYAKLGVASRPQVISLVFVTHIELPPDATAPSPPSRGLRARAARKA